MQALFALFLPNGSHPNDGSASTGRTTRYRQSPPWLLGDGPVVPQPQLVLYELEANGAEGLGAFAAGQLQHVGGDVTDVRAGCYVQVSERQGPAGLPGAILLVFTNPASPAQDADFNAWYDGTHLPDVLKVSGFVAATRYRALDVPGLGASRPTTHAYVAVYELNVDDAEGLAAASAALAEATRGPDAMFISPALDRGTARGQFYIREA